ncbi:MAG: hypothetical protein V4496_00925 [Pseudomonadota bacterium]
MNTKQFLAHTMLASLLYLPISAKAQSTSCDTCSQLSTLNTSAQTISTNTATTTTELYSILELLTNALFSELPSLGNTQVALTNINNAQNSSFNAQQTLLHDVEKAYQGSSSTNATLSNNYQAIFKNYLLKEDGSATSFDANNTSIAALYVNPSIPGYYSPEQQEAARNYIMLASGAAMSTAQAPGSWLTDKIDDKDPDPGKKSVRSVVSAYYTYSAIQSAITDNFAYIYGLNTPQPLIDGPLENYSGGSTISESGLFTYIASQKIENPKWYEEIGSMGMWGLLKEQTVLLGSCFLMLSRIEEDLRRILIMNSVQTTMTLTTLQSTSQALANMPDLKKF